MNIGPVVVVRQVGRSPLYVEVRDRLEIGRDCDGLLLGDAQVSRRHVELRVDGDRLVATDLGSTNGTFVGGTRLAESVEMRKGILVRLGSTTVELFRVASRGFDDRLTQVGNGVDASSTTDQDDGEDLRRTSIDVVARSAARTRWRLNQQSAPVGSTVTIVFSDIESSTELATSLGDRDWYAVLERHNNLVRNLVHMHGGNEIKSQGDGFMLTFPSARAAVEFAVDAQKGIDGILHTPLGQPLRVRIGMHTGEAVSDPDGDLFGRHVIVAARIANLAAGGEILISALVYEIVSSTGDLRFGPIRTVQLKGIPGDHAVRSVEWSEPTSDV